MMSKTMKTVFVFILSNLLGFKSLKNSLESLKSMYIVEKRAREACTNRKLLFFVCIYCVSDIDADCF